MVIGSITETQKLIDDSLKLEQEGVELNMCKALEELEERGREKGRIEGRVEGAIKIYKKMEASREGMIITIMIFAMLGCLWLPTISLCSTVTMLMVSVKHTTEYGQHRAT